MAFTRTLTPGELLSEAAARGDHERVAQLLAEGAPVDWAETGGLFAGRTALHRARTHEVASLLLNAGADPQAKDGLGYTPLHYSPGIADLLLAAGADVNARSNSGSTALHVALFESDDILEPEYLEALLEQLPGIDVNARDEHGLTPIWLAIRLDANRANPDDQGLAKVLAAAGADLDDRGVLEHRQAMALQPAVEDDEEEDAEARAERWEDERNRTPAPWESYSTPREYARSSDMDPRSVEALERVANSRKTARLLESAFSDRAPENDRESAAPKGIL